MGKSSAAKDRPTAAVAHRGERRRGEIVDVAEQVFLTQGFGETTMQMVAVKAGASKETLYRHFGNKQDLFAEVLNNRARRLWARLDANLDRPHAMGDVLRDLGTSLLDGLTSPEVVALLRLVVAEAQRDPDLGRAYYTIGPERMRLRLTAFLTAARERGEFHGRDPALAASIFLGAVMAQTHTELLVLRDPPAMTPADIAERIEEVVAMFLKRYAEAEQGRSPRTPHAG